MSHLKYIVIIIILLTALAGTVFLTLRITVFTNRAASNNSSSVALGNSYLFASPLQAKADGLEKIRITIFILDGRGLGISNKSVELIKPSILSSNSIQAISDDSGKTVFDLSSISAGSYTIEAKTEGNILPQKVKVTFY